MKLVRVSFWVWGSHAVALDGWPGLAAEAVRGQWPRALDDDPRTWG